MAGWGVELVASGCHFKPLAVTDFESLTRWTHQPATSRNLEVMQEYCESLTCWSQRHEHHLKNRRDGRKKWEIIDQLDNESHARSEEV